MAKTNTPFLSLCSQGTVGGSLTSQIRGSATLLREKPVPTDPYSLRQAYQRWLYSDYAYWWTQQSEATRRSYAASGSRYHLTGFQYWMKYNLKNLPDIASWWKLDNQAAGIAYDSGRNSNNGTIVGASPVTGLIDLASYFDGINDIITIPYSSTFNLSPTFSLEVLAKPTAHTTDLYIVVKTDATNWDYQLSILWNTRLVRFGINTPAGTQLVQSTAPLTFDNWHHIIGVNDGTDLLLYLDGTLNNTNPGGGGAFYTRNLPLYIGSYAGAPWWSKGTVDNLILYTRALDSTDALRHSARRYPP